MSDATRTPRLDRLRRWFGAIDAALDYQPTDRLSMSVRDLERRIADLETGGRNAGPQATAGSQRQV